MRPPRAFALCAPRSYDERQLVNGGSAMSGVTNEALVLAIGHRMDCDQKIIQMDTVGGLLIRICIVGPHDEITRADARQFWQQVSRHCKR